MRERSPYIVVVGPTASGKSQLCVALAHSMNGEVVSADSMQIYKELHIGAAKLTNEEMCGVPHHMMDVVSVGDSFTVADYRDRALKCMDEIFARDHVPIVCGGTGLYINALTGKLDFTAIQGDPSLRSELALYAKTEGKQALFARLKKLDALSASRLHPNDQKRVIRALEVTILTGKPYSEQVQSFANSAYTDVPALLIGLRWERKSLELRIRERVDSMMAQGLLEETKTLFTKGIPLEHPSMMGLGYRQLLQYLSGQIALKDAVERIKVDTRRFAKRQMTWFSRDLRIHWLNMDTETDLCVLLRSIRTMFMELK